MSDVLYRRFGGGREGAIKARGMGQGRGFLEQAPQVCMVEILPTQEEALDLLRVADIFKGIGAGDHQGSCLALAHAAEAMPQAHELRWYEGGAAQHVCRRDARLLPDRHLLMHRITGEDAWHH